MKTGFLGLLNPMGRMKLVLVVLSSLALTSCGGSGGGTGGGNGGSGGGGGGGTSSYSITVTKSAAIGGTVTSTPAGISCDTTCTTQTASFTGATDVTLAVTPNTAQSAIFTGWDGAGCSGVKSCSLTLSSNASISANFIALSSNQLGLFVVTIGGSGTDYAGFDGSGNSITISSTNYLFSEVIPSAKQWVVLDSFTSESWGPWETTTFKQGDQVFEVLEAVPPSQCDFKTFFNPSNSSVTSFGLFDGGGGSNSLYNWEMNHVGIVGDNVYYKVPVEWDMFHLAYDIGGEYDMLPSGGKSTTLLGRTDPNNGANYDLADNGTIYAIYHNSQQGYLNVYTRDLTTGDLATAPLRSYDTSAAEPLYKNWQFAINDSTLYITLTQNSDGSFQVWSTDLTVPLAQEAIPIVVATYPTSAGVSPWTWGVDNGHVVMSYQPAGSKTISGVADLDTTTGNTQYYDLGTFIISVAPVWMNASSSASVNHGVSTRHRSPARALVPVTTLRPIE